MTPELEDKLFKDFPLLYDRKADYRSSGMGFGFECGDGWYQLIRELSEKLYPLVEAQGIDEYGSSCAAVQVKEKYGTLRFYMSSSTDAMFDLIEDYEDRSSRVCEKCGRPGQTIRHAGWLSTLCEEHRKK